MSLGCGEPAGPESFEEKGEGKEKKDRRRMNEGPSLDTSEMGEEMTVNMERRYRPVR